MRTAKNGDRVVVQYIGKLEDGTIFDTTVGQDPFEFTIGENEVIPGFEEAIIGMEEGERKVVIVKPDRAFGEKREDYIVKVSKDVLPPDLEVTEGMTLKLSQEGINPIPVKVTQVGDDFIVIDANHPLAGHTLTFEITLLKIL